MRRTAVQLGACVLAGIAAAPPSVPAADTAADFAALGRAEAVFSYCRKVAPATADEHRDRVRALSMSMSKASLEQARRSEEYRKGRRAVEEFVAKVDAHNAPLVCARRAAGKK